MVLEKKSLSFDDIEAQGAFELPDREMMLVTVVITNLLNNLSVRIPVQNNNVAVQVCAIVDIIEVNLFPGVNAFSCEVHQR